MSKSYGGFAQAALVLRSGLGILFIIGGLSKLSLLLNPTTHDAMVDNYMGTSGYINSLFQNYLFGLEPGGSFLTPSAFLTGLSTFELLSGIALVAGILVRPLALFYGFLLWTFVVSLPVMTVPGQVLDVKTYTSPAMMVQIRDIALSGMMFVLFNLGAGTRALDNRFAAFTPQVSWDHLGLLLRFSVAMIFIVGGFFGHFANIASFATNQVVLAVIGLCLVFGSVAVVRGASVCAVAVMVWYIAQKLSFDRGIIANLNGFKREFAIAAAGAVLARLGGGSLFTLPDLANRARGYFRFPSARSPTEVVPDRPGDTVRPDAH